MVVYTRDMCDVHLFSIEECISGGIHVHMVGFYMVQMSHVSILDTQLLNLVFLCVKSTYFLLDEQFSYKLFLKWSGDHIVAFII
jgi:hypothetical protein